MGRTMTAGAHVMRSGTSEPTLIGRKGELSEFVKTQRLTSLAQMQDRNLIPAFVSIDRLRDALADVRDRDFGKDELDAAVERERGRLGKRSRAVNPQILDGRLAATRLELQRTYLADAVRGRSARALVAPGVARALELRPKGSLSVVELALDRPLQLEGQVHLGREIDLIRAPEVKLNRGAVAHTFGLPVFMAAGAVAGPGCFDVTGRSGNAGNTGDPGPAGTVGSAGNNAQCQGIFGKDVVPSNGGKGGNGGNGTTGGAGGNGDVGGTFELHVEVLGPGLCVHADGGSGGDGGTGGAGGAGGTGGGGGNGNDCEPSGVGGAGGNGGAGGQGGPGASGGAAGSIIIYYVSDQSASSPPTLVATGGEGGRGGDGGVGGAGGAVGAQGTASKYGKARWDPGGPKSPGDPGAPGGSGSQGRTGSGSGSNIALYKVQTVNV